MVRKDDLEIAVDLSSCCSLGSSQHHKVRTLGKLQRSYRINFQVKAPSIAGLPRYQIKVPHHARSPSSLQPSTKAPPHLIELGLARTNEKSDLNRIINISISLKLFSSEAFHLISDRRVFRDLIRGADDVSPESDDTLPEKEAGEIEVGETCK